MSLLQTLIFASLSIFVGLVTRNRFRATFLLVLSILAVYWLQPSLPIRYLDFWLPTLTISITFISWVLTSQPEQHILRENRLTAFLVAGIVLLLALIRLVPALQINLTINPPQTWQVLVLIIMVGLSAALLNRFRRPFLLTGLIVILIAMLVILKSPALSAETSIWLRGLNAQSIERASAVDIRWLGFSYIVFRLIHTIRDRQAGRMPQVSLREYITYVVFFPSLTAGPIDRAERFLGDLRKPLALTEEDWIAAGGRFFIGMFKKYVIADSLALIALNGTNASQVEHTRWAWVLLYAYTLQIYFDFSGYTDIVIGIARIIGFKLPENFNSPYLKPNLTQFWNNWHMTLTQWFRAYYFNPVNRWLRGLKKTPSVSVQILLMQTSTMLLIGLWHGITWNFVLWGLWHGLGLFVQNRWSDAVKVRLTAWANSRFRQIGLNAVGVFLTFNFVALGWVFFALPAPATSLDFFALLFGVG